MRKWTIKIILLPATPDVAAGDKDTKYEDHVGFSIEYFFLQDDIVSKIYRH